MKIIREYGTHHYTSVYEKSELYCPNCGAKEVWTDQGMGDYYQGSESACTACGCISHLDHMSMAKEPYDLGVLEQLKTKVTAEPKSPRGS